MQMINRQTHNLKSNMEFKHHSDILEACLSSLVDGKTTVENCVKAHPDFPELANLLLAAQAVQSVRPVMLSQMSKWKMRERMLTYYRTQRAFGRLNNAPQQARRVARKVSALALFIIVSVDLTILVGLALAANRALFGNQPGLESVFSIFWTVAFGVALYGLMVYIGRSKRRVNLPV